MMTHARMAVIAFFALLFLCLPARSDAGETLWNFEGPDALAGWRFERAAARLKDGNLVIEEGSFPGVYSPGGVNIESGQSVFTFRAKTNKPGLVKLSLYSAHTNFTYALSFYVQATKDYRDYRVYLGDIIPGGEIFYDFAFKLPGNKLNASIDSISFHSPGKWELAGIFWDGFWEAKPVLSAGGINAPRFGTLSMMTILNCFVVLTTIVLIVVGYLKSSRFTRALLFKSLLIGFALSALLFTFRVDVNFLNMWRVDRATLSNKSEGERIRAINNGNYDSYFDFIDEMKSLIPEGEEARPAGRPVNGYFDQIARNIAYNLLPVRSSPRAKYLWLYFDDIDRGVTYDSERLVLKRGDTVLASDVRLLKLFGSEAALYVKGSGLGTGRHK